MRTAVQFGAGNIGRGFIAQLFSESGYETVFVDVIPGVVAALNDHNRYTIHIVGDDAHDVEVANVRAISGTELYEVANVVAECEIVSTAVGANALKHIAPGLAKGLELRYSRRGGPLNILICENLHDAAEVLRDAIEEYLPYEMVENILNQTGFVQAVVSRMVPLQEPDRNEPLSIRVESYTRLPVDGSSHVGSLPEIRGVEPVDNFLAHVERKLYTHNCAHATIGYLGYLKGHEFGWQALEDPAIYFDLDAVLKETGEALIRKH